MLRALLIFLEVIAGLVGIVVVLGLILIWRLSTGPIYSSFATPYLEAAIEGLVPGTTTRIAHTLLTLDTESHSVALHADGIRITEKNGTVIAEVPNVDMRLSLVGIIFGQFLPTELMIDHPELKLERYANGAFIFGGMVTQDRDDGGTGDIKKSLARAADYLAHAYFTHRLEIHDAVFAVHDTATNSDWSVHVPQIMLERMKGDMTGTIALAVTQKKQASTIDIQYSYDRSKALHRLAARFSDITPAFFAGGHPATLGLAPAAAFNLPLTGDIALAFDDALDLAGGAAQLHGGSGFLDDPDFWDAPRAVKSLDIGGDYDRNAERLSLTAAVDFGGPRLTLAATGKSALLSAHRMNLNLSVLIDNWPMDQYGQLWPKPIIADARDWIAANLSKGKFDHGEAVLKGTFDLANPSGIAITEGSGKVLASGGSVKYVDGMPPVEGVNAAATFDLQHMTMDVWGGGIGDIRVLPFTLAISGFQEDTQTIEIPLHVGGPIPAILKLIDAPPLGYTTAAGLTPGDIDGKAEATVTFRFPLLKTLAMKDIDIRASANLTGVSSTKLVKGVDIAQGNLALALDPHALEVKGPAVLNKMPLQIRLKQNFAPAQDQPMRQIELTGGFTADQAQAFGIDLFDGTRGPMGVTLDITQPDKTATTFAGAIDMTPADVRIDRLNWKKPAGAPATVTFAAEKTGANTIAITSIAAQGPQLNIKGNAVFAAEDGRISSLNLDPMIVGRTNGALRFAQDADRNGALRFEATGKAFDISGLKGGHDPEHADPRPKEYRIELGRLYTSENGFIENVKGYATRDLQGWSEISLHGRADGAHQLDIDLTKRDDGGRTFTLACDDFGKALKGLGFTDTVRDGKLDIRGESDPENPRVILGTVDIGHFTVGHLPVLAVLMNAASPFGFAGLFSDSMDFDSLRGKFSWDNDMMRLIGIHAAGASVGINAGGKIDTASGDADLRGTMVPFSVMNSVLNEIPLIGELITGGKGQGIFAVSYSITGPLGDPHIGVNPVSLLTPGFLRNLVFGSGDDEDETPETKSSPASR